MLVVGGGAASARAAEPVSYAVNARVVVDEGVVTGAMHADVRVAEGQAIESLR